MSNVWFLVVIIAVSLTLLGVIVWLVASEAASTAPGSRGRHRAVRRPHRNSFRAEDDVVEPPRKRAAIILNPTKFENLDAVRDQLVDASEALGWDPPHIMLTSEEDPGTGQTKQAVADGVDVVCAFGGDGTIRAVASALIGSDTPMGLLPKGTGNLLARNLEIPVDRLESALEIAYTGRNRRIDVGWVTLDARAEEEAVADPGADHESGRHIFLVMAGMGFDATVMSGTSETAKAKMGWPAYVATGLRNLKGPGFKAQVQVDLTPEIHRRTRSVIIGNCGKLTGGIPLMPDAEIDDGVLDCVVVSPKGVVGWGAVAAQVLTRSRRGHERLERYAGREVNVASDVPEEIEIDGDIIGRATRMAAWVEPVALIVRVEATAHVDAPSPPEASEASPDAATTPEAATTPADVATAEPTSDGGSVSEETVSDGSEGAVSDESASERANSDAAPQAGTA